MTIDNIRVKAWRKAKRAFDHGLNGHDRRRQQSQSRPLHRIGDFPFVVRDKDRGQRFSVITLFMILMIAAPATATDEVDRSDAARRQI
jgi:hypothetical protein